MKNAIIIIGRAYHNILSILYEAGEVPNCDVYVIRTRHDRSFLFRGRYIDMQPEPQSVYLKKRYLVIGSDSDDDIWMKISEAIHEIDLAGAYKRIIFMPVSDIYSLMLNAHKNEFSDKYVFHGVGARGAGDYSWLSEKHNQKKIAEKFGIPVAKGRLVVKSEVAPYEGPYPCIVKIPQSVQVYTETKGIVGRCATEHELNLCLEKAWSYGLSAVLVEELLPISYELGVSGVCVAGKMLGIGAFRKRAVCTGERLGDTISGEVINVAADKGLSDFVNRVEQLLKHVEYNGIFDIDMACACGRFYLLEINLRVGAFTFSVVSAGLPLVRLYMDAMDGVVTNARMAPCVFGVPALNERSLIEEMGANKISLVAYFRELRRGRSRKIKNEKDRGPYNVFLRASIWAVISNLIGPCVPFLRKAHRIIRKKC